MTTLVPERRRSNLPAEATSFIGRRRELSQVREALERYRLVTLRGVGGVGKTRLARNEVPVPADKISASRHPSPKRPATLAKLIAIFFD